MSTRRIGWISLWSILLVGPGGALAHPPVPWRLRARPGVHPSRAAALRARADQWPPEPPSPPHPVDPQRYAAALRTLCGWMPRERQTRWTASLLAAAYHFGVDPFLLGALVHRMSRCKANAESLSGLGATLIAPGMLRGHLHHGRYRYFVWENGRWHARHLAMPLGGLHPARLARFEPNVHMAAGLLRVFREQHHGLDAHLPQAPHRHFVSHFVWGDRVPSSRAEDRILLDRRRLLQYYGTWRFDVRAHWRGIALAPPLDGGLRVVSSFPGDPRDGGARRHRGIDIEAVAGEPVRAQADGRVSFAGVDLPGPRHKRQLPPERQFEVPSGQLGRGGRFVCVLHASPDSNDWLQLCYMHLRRYEVRRGQRVHAGEILGRVGRTGMRISAPHLHLEAVGSDGRMNPAALLDPLLLGPPRSTPPPRHRPRRADRTHTEEAPAP